MRNLILPNKELRILSGQLQNFNQGYNVLQIRSLQRIVSNIEDKTKTFTDGLTKLFSMIVRNTSKEEHDEDEVIKQREISDYMETKGNELVTCSFQDEDFELIKTIWGRMGTLSGTKEAREAIIKIDDAIQGVTEPTFAFTPKNKTIN